MVRCNVNGRIKDEVPAVEIGISDLDFVSELQQQSVRLAGKYYYFRWKTISTYVFIQIKFL